MRNRRQVVRAETKSRLRISTVRLISAKRAQWTLSALADFIRDAELHLASGV